MFIGHFALGFAAKRATPQLSLAVLFLACQLADILWPVLVAAGIEHVRIAPGITAVTPLEFTSYPYSHSLVALILWGTLLGSAFWLAGSGGRTALVVGGLVVSHWVLDVITHRPDMPVYPGSEPVGLGLWRSTPATLAVEVPLFIVGVWLYAAATRARDRTGRVSFAVLTALLAIAYIGNLAGGAPPSVRTIYWTGIAGAMLITALSWWTDRQREALGP